MESTRSTVRMESRHLTVSTGTYLVVLQLAMMMASVASDTMMAISFLFLIGIKISGSPMCRGTAAKYMF